MAERIVSQRVVSRRVVGSANPIAKKFRDLKGSISGVCIAPIVLLIAFGVLFWGEKFQKSSVVVESLTLENAEEVTATSGTHKMSGVPVISTYAEAPEVGDVLYFTYKKQEYKEVEKTETETVTTVENGMEVEEEVETVKMVEEWVDLETDSSWAEFKLGNYSVNPSGASLKLDLSTKTYKLDILTGEYEESTVSAADTLGDKRLVVQYLPKDKKLLIVGDISGTNIVDGNTYIITTKTDEQLLSDLKTTESVMYWVAKGASWLLLTIGFLMSLGPILSALDFIPIAGKAANCAASVVGAVLAAIIVLLGTFIIRYWYICLGLAVILVVGLVVLLVVLVMRKKDGGTEKVSSSEDA